MNNVELPAVVLVTRKSTYDADADACISTWVASSRASLGRMDGCEYSALACELVRGQVKDVMPLMFNPSKPILEPTLAEATLSLGYASVRFIVQILPEIDLLTTTVPLQP